MIYKKITVNAVKLLMFIAMVSTLFLPTNSYAKEVEDEYITSYIENGGYSTSLGGMAARRLYVYGILDDSNIIETTQERVWGQNVINHHFDNDENFEISDAAKILYRLNKLHKNTDFSINNLGIISSLSIDELIEKNNQVTEKGFALALTKWMGYNYNLFEKAKELGLMDCDRTGDRFTKGDAYLMVCKILDMENIFEIKENFREEFLPPKELKIYVSSYEDMLMQMEEALPYCPEKVHIEFTDNCPDKDKSDIYRYFVTAYYAWKGYIENDYIYVDVFDPFFRLPFITDYCKGLDSYTSSLQLGEYPEMQAIVSEFENELNLTDMTEIEKKIEVIVKIFELCENKPVLTVRTDGMYEHMYLNLDIKNDWLYCYENPEYAETIRKYAEKKLESLKDLSDYDKVLKIQNLICAGCSYDYAEERRLNNRPGSPDEPHWWTHEISGYFTHKKIVCDGYAYVFSWMANYLDVDSYVVYGGMRGNDDVGHAWNKVKVDNSWYNIDVCWADTGEGMSNFLKSDKYFSSNGHIFEEDYIPNISAPKNYTKNR